MTGDSTTAVVSPGDPRARQLARHHRVNGRFLFHGFSWSSATEASAPGPIHFVVAALDRRIMSTSPHNTQPTAARRLRKHTLSPSASVSLDVVRACAAVVVMLGHVRGLFFVPFDASTHPGWFTQAIYLGTTLGHQAVMVFFVLSGFLVGGSVLGATAEDRWSWRAYLIRRLSRLYIVLIPALCLTAMWDFAGVHAFGSLGVYSGLPSDSAILPHGFLSTDTLHTLLGNSAFLMTIAVPVFGTNGPLWSLANEFWYYVLFPVMLLAIVSRGRAGKRIAYGLCLMVLLVFLPFSIVLLFPTWLLGTLLFKIPSHRLERHSKNVTTWISLIVLVLTAIIARRWIASSVFADYLVACLCMCFLYVLVRTDSSVETAPAKSTNQRLHKRFWARFAGFSYTLYLVHLPPLVFVHAWLYARGIARWQPDAQHLLLAGVLSVATVVYAYVISLGTEARTDSLRRWLEERSRSLVLRFSRAGVPE